MKNLLLLIILILSIDNVVAQNVSLNGANAFSDIDTFYGCNTTSTINPAACDFYISPSGNYTWTSSGIYNDTIPNAAGCDSIMTIDLTVNPSPIVMLGPDVAVCQGQSVVLDAGVPGGIYMWSTGETTQSIFVTTSGTYTVTVTAAGGCTGSDAVTVTINPNPITPITGQTSICNGSSTTFCAAPGYACYIWSIGATTQCINVTTAGTYTVTVCDMNGCTGTTSVTLTLNPLPTPIITGIDTICQGNTTVFDAGAGYASYLWSPGHTTQTILANTAGPYTVTVTDANGCTGSATKTLYVNPSPFPNITGDSTLCPGQSTILDPGAVGVALAYLWNTGETTQVITVTTLGTYIVTVSNSFGCTGSDSFTITAAAPIATVLSASGPLGICSGDSVQLTAQSPMISYQWHKNNSPISGATDSTFWASTTGWYKCLSTDLGNCPATSNQVRVAVVCFPPLPPSDKVAEPIKNQNLDFTVAPNPSDGSFTIFMDYDLNEVIEIRLYDVTGKLVMNDVIKSNSTLINLDQPKPGYYFLEMSAGSYSTTRKQIVIY